MRRSVPIARNRTARSRIALLPILALAAVGAAGTAPSPALGQDGHILLPVDSVERLLSTGTFDLVDRRGSRFDGDRTSRAVLVFPDDQVMVVKWAPAPRGGEAFNNSPRYEAAAYRLQKLFLGDHELVVPPTALRAFPLSWYRRLDPRATATFSGTESILVALQYWLFNVSGDEFWDRSRLERDSAYARAIGQFNLLTYLARHNDANEGNYLVSTVPGQPRVFTVDNGLSFSSRVSDQGAPWRRLRVDRLPSESVARLRALSEADIVRQLETVAEFRVDPDGRLEPTPPGPNIDPGRGVRRQGRVVQLGLTRSEIRDVWQRLRSVLAAVDSGEIEVF